MAERRAAPRKAPARRAPAKKAPAKRDPVRRRVPKPTVAPPTLPRPTEPLPFIAPPSPAPAARPVPSTTPDRLYPGPPPRGWIVEPGPAHWSSTEVGRAVAFLAVFLLAEIAVSVAVGEVWLLRIFDTAVYGLICGAAMALLGVVPWQTRLMVRLAFAAALGALVFVALGVGGPLRGAVLFYYLLLLPVWAVVVVTGTGRFRWSATKFLGATLLLIAVWRPIYGSFPDLTSLGTSTGVLEPYSVTALYQIVALKLFHESVFALCGIFLLLGRFPFVQKMPEKGDAHSTFLQIQGASRHPMWLTVGLGAFTFAAALIGTAVLGAFLSGTRIAEAGADDTRVFENMTPLLVILLSFAAGLGEELLFRAALQPAFERAFRTFMPTWLAIGFAIFVQAVLFGVVHAGYGNPLHVILPFGFGIIAGIAYRMWGIVPAVYAHAMIDVIAFGVDAAVTRPWVETVLVLLILLNLLFGIGCLAYVLVMFVRDRFLRRTATPAE